MIGPQRGFITQDIRPEAELAQIYWMCVSQHAIQPHFGVRAPQVTMITLASYACGHAGLGMRRVTNILFGDQTLSPEQDILDREHCILVAQRLDDCMHRVLEFRASSRGV